MELLKEGRKEDILKKYEDLINTERKLNSSVKQTSFYDEIIKEPFMQRTNFKYLEPLIKQFYFSHDVSPVKGEELDKLIPLSKSYVDTHLNWMFDQISTIIKTLNFFDTNKERLPIEYRDINKFVGDMFWQFIDYLKVFERQKSNREIEREIKRNTDVIYSGQTSYIIKPKSYESSCLYGANTRWCTASRESKNQYVTYTKKGNLYYVIITNIDSKSRFKKIAIQTFFDGDFNNSRIYWDSFDNPMPKEQEELFESILGEEALRAIKSDFEKSKSNLSDAHHKDIIDFLENTEPLNFDLVGNLNYTVNNGLVRIEMSLYNIKYVPDADDPYDTIRLKVSFEMIEEGTEESIIKLTYYIICKKLKDNYIVRIVINFVEELINYNDFKTIIPKISNFEFKKPIGINPELFISQLINSCYTVLSQSFYSENRQDMLSYIYKRRNLQYTPSYTFANYKFTRGGRLTKELISYLDKLDSNNTVTKKQFLLDVGRIRQTDTGWVNKMGKLISLKGYLSSFFSAVKQAGITQGIGQSFTQGPRFDEYKKKFDL